MLAPLPEARSELVQKAELPSSNEINNARDLASKLEQTVRQKCKCGHFKTKLAYVLRLLSQRVSNLRSVDFAIRGSQIALLRQNIEFDVIIHRSIPYHSAQSREYASLLKP